MSKPFFLWPFLGVVSIMLILFFPIFLRTVAHYDMNRKKFCFSIYLFSFIKILGGYVATYKGGLAVHLSPKKAYLLPYNQVNQERKRFSFTRSFYWKKAMLTTESGAEYLLLTMLLHAILRFSFLIKGGNFKKIHNNVWLTEGDVFKLSLSITVWFNLFLLLKNFLMFIKEKIQILWRKKVKNSAA